MPEDLRAGIHACPAPASPDCVTFGGAVKRDVNEPVREVNSLSPMLEVHKLPMVKHEEGERLLFLDVKSGVYV